MNLIRRPGALCALFALMGLPLIISQTAVAQFAQLPAALEADPCSTRLAGSHSRPADVIRVGVMEDPNANKFNHQTGTMSDPKKDPAAPKEFTIYDLLALVSGQRSLSYHTDVTFDSKSYSPEVAELLRMIFAKSKVEIRESNFDFEPRRFKLSETRMDSEIMTAALKAAPHAYVRRTAGVEWKEFKTLLQHHSVLVHETAEGITLVRNPNWGRPDRFLHELGQMPGEVEFHEMLALLRRHETPFENLEFSISENGTNSRMRDVIHEEQFLQDTWVAVAKIEGRNNKSLASKIHADSIEDLTTVIYWPYRSNQARVRVNYVKGKPASLESMIRVQDGWAVAIYLRDEEKKAWVQQETLNGKPLLHLCMECHGAGANFGPAVKMLNRNELAPGYFNYARPIGHDAMFGDALLYTPTAGDSADLKLRDPVNDLVHAFRDGRLYLGRPKAVWDFATRTLVPTANLKIENLEQLGMFGTLENRPPTKGIALPVGLLPQQN